MFDEWRPTWELKHVLWPTSEVLHGEPWFHEKGLGASCFLRHFHASMLWKQKTPICRRSNLRFFAWGSVAASDCGCQKDYIDMDRTGRKFCRCFTSVDRVWSSKGCELSWNVFNPGKNIEILVVIVFGRGFQNPKLWAKDPWPPSSWNPLLSMIYSMIQ